MPTNIEWTDETWNPVTGCTRVSPGCDHCYMYAMYPRLKAMGLPSYSTGPDDVQLFPRLLEAPLKWRKRRRVFVCSMSDLFHSGVPLDFIYQVFQVMTWSARDRGHVFQVLTKRPGRAAAFWNEYRDNFQGVWHPNIWMGTSVENQKYAPRLTVLGRIPAPVKFVSAEPLLGPLDLSRWLEDGTLQWVIVGGESGPGARPMDLDWARDLRDQASAAGVPLFLKQLGGPASAKRGGGKAVLDGCLHHQMPGGVVNR